VESTAVSQRLVAEIRDRSGLTQAQLARRAGMPRSVVNAYERGKRVPGTDALARLAASAGLQLGLSPAVRSVDPERAARILSQVLDLAESLPSRRRGKLRFPPLKERAR
jgi:transcriptional regulator with XRE-family HTH domain